MDKLKLPLITLVSVIILFSLHLWGMNDNLYMKFWYYDIIQHILGGVCIALAIYTVTSVFNLSFVKNNLYLIIILSFIAGLAWEVFEVMFDIAGHELWTTEYNIDSTKDLFNDTLGAVIVYFLIKK